MLPSFPRIKRSEMRNVALQGGEKRKERQTAAAARGQRRQVATDGFSNDAHFDLTWHSVAQLEQLNSGSSRAKGFQSHRGC